MRYRFILNLLFVVLIFNQLKAQTNQAISPESNSTQLISNLIQDQKANTTWWYSWLGLYSVGTVVQTGIALQTDNKALKQDMYLGAATTLLGAGAQLFTPYPKIDISEFRNFNNLPEVQQKELLMKAEEYLKLSAQYEKDIRSWKNHATCSAVNLASGLITWLAFDRTLKDGIINFAINTAITEAQIWTIPVKAKKQYEQLLSGDTSALNNSFQLNASATPGGMKLCLIF